jgi:hypothetical protein
MLNVQEEIIGLIVDAHLDISVIHTSTANENHNQNAEWIQIVQAH